MRTTKLLAGAALALALAACTGEKGETGPAGATGAKGDQGAQGPQGSKGDPGTNGGTGATGATGPAGATGATGPAGQNGADGQDGANGHDGQDGTNGRNGADGRNGYVVGSGLILELQQATITGTTATVRFRITDAQGLALDRSGRATVGPVTASFVLAWLDQNATGQALQYTAYTTRSQTSPITHNTAVQAGTDSGGRYVEIDPANGVYDYVFHTPIHVADPTKTHTVGAYATRTFEDVRYVANAELDFRPDGSAVAVTRHVFDTTACNTCHNQLQAHGGARRDGQLCILCHQPQTVDPDTGNTVDMKVMIHKIHRGADLPSVASGTPYEIIGFNQTVADYSTVAFPGVINRCSTCHTTAQRDYASTSFSRAACTSCHDRTSFVDPVPPGYTLHMGGTQDDDGLCRLCHQPNTFYDVAAAHRDTFEKPTTVVPELTIVSVSHTAPGQNPVIRFNVKMNGVVRNILTTPLTSLRVTAFGPTTDVASYWQATIQGTGASGTLVAVGSDFQYTMAAPMPASAAGSYNFGLEGYDQANSSAPRLGAFNPIATATVTDAAAVPRREVIDQAKCNGCHYRLAAHGGSRTNVQYCAACHNPNNYNDDRVARVEGTTVYAASVNFKDMIHRIHRGDKGENPYVLGGNPSPTPANPQGSPQNFGEVRFPGDLRDCETCHKPGTFGIALPRTMLPSTSAWLQCTEDPAADANSYCDTRVVSSTELRRPITAACLGCHDGDATAAHAELQTTASGVEACATCHGVNKDWDVLQVHVVQ